MEIRSEPSVKSNPIGLAVIGEGIEIIKKTNVIFTIKDTSDHWYEIIWQNKKGYIWGGLITQFYYSCDIDGDKKKEFILAKNKNENVYIPEKISKSDFENIIISKIKDPEITSFMKEAYYLSEKFYLLDEMMSNLYHLKKIFDILSRYEFRFEQKYMLKYSIPQSAVYFSKTGKIISVVQWIGKGSYVNKVKLFLPDHFTPAIPLAGIYTENESNRRMVLKELILFQISGDLLIEKINIPYESVSEIHKTESDIGFPLDKDGETNLIHIYEKIYENGKLTNFFDYKYIWDGKEFTKTEPVFG